MSSWRSRCRSTASSGASCRSSTSRDRSSSPPTSSARTGAGTPSPHRDPSAGSPARQTSRSAMSNDGSPKVRIVHRKNRLQDKVGGRPGAKGEIDPKLIGDAQAAVAKLMPDYESQAAKELAAIQAAVVEANASSGRTRLMAGKRIEALTHEVR